MIYSAPCEVVRSADSLPRNPEVITGIGKQFNFGRGQRSLQKRESGLSFPSELTAAGCALLCLKALERHEEVKLFFSGNGAALFPDAAVEFVKKNFPTIPEDCIMEPDRDSPTTQDSVRNVPTILKEHGYSTTVLGTVDRHVKRTAHQFEQSDSSIVSCMASTDFIVAESSAANLATVEAWRDSPLTKIDGLMEELLFYIDRGTFGRMGEIAVRAYRP